MLLRKYLIKIRDMNTKDPKNLYFYSVVVFLSCAIISLLVDAFLPWENWWVVPRSLLVIPLSLSAFTGLYALSLTLSAKKQQEHRADGEEWVPLRLRYSPKWRRNVSIIAGAVLFVIAYSTNDFTGFTIFSSLIITAVLGLITFCRLTRAENKRAQMNLVDPRDSMFDSRMRQYEAERARKAEEAKTSDEKDVIHDNDDERVMQSVAARAEEAAKSKNRGLR